MILKKVVNALISIGWGGWGIHKHVPLWSQEVDFYFLQDYLPAKMNSVGPGGGGGGGKAGDPRMEKKDSLQDLVWETDLLLLNTE